MTVNLTNAVAAYARSVKDISSSGMEPRSADPSQTFADLVGQSMEAAIEAGRRSDQMSVQAIAGRADLNEVVSAVTNAEITLQTVLAIRDRMIQAYQEIVQMPI